MIGFDILIENDFSRKELKKNIVEFFDEIISDEEILICTDILETEINDNVRVIIEELYVKGDFKIILMFQFLTKKDTLKRSVFEFIKQLSENLKTKILFPDDSLDPFSYYLIHGKASDLVSLNSKLYEEGIYVLEK